MDEEIELINDGDGFAVIGEPSVVERFLHGNGLEWRELHLDRVGRKSAEVAGAAALVGAQMAEHSGRWVKLTKESAQAMHRLPLMTGSNPGAGRAIVMQNGKIKSILEIAQRPTMLAANPAILTGVAGLMAQVAMQQAMDEITDYLKEIDEKLDDLLRAQKDAVFADMIGVDLALTDALRIRERMGKLPETTWQRIQHTSVTLDTVQAYSLRRLDALAEKLESRSNVGELADASTAAAKNVRDWLAVLARCYQLQDAFAILELDRVLDSHPHELEEHRTALRMTRSHRRDLIGRSTKQLLARMDAAAERANGKVLLHPLDARSVVDARNKVSVDLGDFHGLLGIESLEQSLESKRWRIAAAEAKDKAVDLGGDGVAAAKKLGDDAYARSRSFAGRAARAFADRASKGQDDRPSGSTGEES